MFYVQLGQLPRKRHVAFKKDNGELFREQLFGLKGFSGISSLVYKEELPPATLFMRSAGKVLGETHPEDDFLAYRHLKTSGLPQEDSLAQKRRPLMYNHQVEISVGYGPPAGLFRNASHHELWYLETGEGRLISEFGILRVCAGDYVSIPKGITCEWDYSQDARFLLTQSLEPIVFPRRYLNEMGQFLEHSPICERDIKVPDELYNPQDKGETTVLIRRDSEYFEQGYNHHPFDTVGWDGYLYPFAISIHDFEPIVGRLHMPPPVHQIFESGHFVVCNFVPRLFDFHPEAIPAPYFHSNLDSDEVIFYVEGNFMSRSGIEPGSISLHPAGVPHGPQPGKTEASIGEKATEELAVMIDTFQPLKVTSRARMIEDEAYVRSWVRSEEK